MQCKFLHLFIGPLLLVLCVCLLPKSVFTHQQSIALGTMLWMGWWWVTSPINPGLTALLPIVVNALFCLAPMPKISGLYFSDIVILLLGANIISATWESKGLDKRIALKALCLLGESLRQHIIAWFLIAVILSSVLPNAVVCTLLTSIAIAMFAFLKGSETEIPKPVIYVLLTAIVWGCGIGGLGTPLGGAMNLVAVSYIEQFTGKEYFYWDWVKTLFPFLVILSAVTLLFLDLIRPKKITLGKSKSFFKTQYENLGAFSLEQAMALVLFILPLILSFLREYYASLLPGLKPAHLFLIFGLFAFMLPGKDGQLFISWKEAKAKIEWEILFLFAGGLALGHLLIATGTTKTAATLIASMHIESSFVLLVVICLFTMFFVEVASNTAAAAISIPMIIGITTQMHLDTMVYIYAAVAAFNTGFMLPTSIRAIPIAYGLSPAYLFKKGMAITMITILVIASLAQIVLG